MIRRLEKLEMSALNVTIATANTFDIYQKERNGILDFLSISRGRTGPDVPLWKVLLYDERGQKILAPLVKLGALRQNGVTLNLMVHCQRYPVSDAAAIYFMEPTARNLNRIVQDVKDRLYKSFYVEFITPISQDELRDFAKKVAVLPPGSAPLISRVADRYLDFIALSPTSFILDLPDTFPIIYSPRADDMKIQSELNRIVAGLVSVVHTLGVRPVIYCPKNVASPARAVGILLNERLSEIKEAWQDVDGWPHPHSDLASAARHRKPPLILCDRSLDFSCMLGHAWSYQSLIHDVFGIESNRVTITDEAGGKKKTYDLEPTDSFFAEHAALNYPEIAVAISEMLEEFNKKLKNLNAGRKDLDLMNSDVEGDKLTTSVSQALNSAPEIIGKKQALDMHTTIAGALLEAIKARALDKFCEIETSLADTFFGSLQSANQVCANVEAMLKDPSCGNFSDKYRLLLCLHLFKGQLTKAQIDKCAQTLVTQCPDPSAAGLLPALKFLRHYETLSQLRHDDTYGSLLTEAPIHKEQSALSTAAASLLDRSKGLLLQGVKHLIPPKQQWKIVQLCDNLLEARNSSVAESYDKLDPLAAPGDIKPAVHRKAVVFVVGGGSYVESEALNEFARKSQKEIIYGSSSMVRPCNFLKFCEDLGRLI
eukprot:Blabericola_migrator_1__977@NODE_1244_length_5004_cov_49_974681_g841_i0_p1_GENE_NODE_1244_length_5004_cov_49_974681_g841_i0NODE_1244_length_5004_cov_49_974681_g841_i0_p1_ORF_typecomplete_len653_score135_20Sec1/PF00995_23/1_8e91Laminin_II/PF06009_12/0_43_NODE_1244_length_5004_cov_49_974681_g841_i030154973